MPPTRPAIVRPIPYATAALIAGLIVSAPAAAQTPAVVQDVRMSDPFEYARFGAGRGGATFGLGVRGATRALAIDVSVSAQLPVGSRMSAHIGGRETVALSLLKVEVLRFREPRANASSYFGGGISVGTASSWGGPDERSWHGRGLQGELTLGYEIGSASTARLFVQADATLPFYVMTSGHPGGTRYAPSLFVSVGVGWQRGRR
jgi:hypothetical protein